MDKVEDLSDADAVYSGEKRLLYCGSRREVCHWISKNSDHQERYKIWDSRVGKIVTAEKYFQDLEDGAGV